MLPVRPEAVVGSDGKQHILDVGTGTGCISITLALERPKAMVTAIDISPDALALARDNALRLNASVILIQSNWFAALPIEAQFNLIVSNPPYIVPGDAHLGQGDLRFEPVVALVDAVDGLGVERAGTQPADQGAGQVCGWGVGYPLPVAP